MKEVTILIGTIIGSGILSLPYVFHQAGFILSVFEMFLVYLLFIYIALLYSKISLKFGKHQFPGYIEIFFGREIKTIILSIMLITLYGTILSYYIAQSNALYKLFGINKYISLTFIFLILNLVLIKNIKSVSDFEKANVLIVIILIISTILYFLTFYKIDIRNIMNIHVEKWIIPIGPVIFSLFGLSAIPEMRELINDFKTFKKAILIGYTVPFVLYVLFTFAIIATHHNIPPIATFLLGPVGYLLTFFITLNPMISLSYVIKEIYLFDLKLSEKISHFLTVIPSFLLALIINNLESFVYVLSFVGWISLFLYIPLIVIIFKKCCKD